MRTTKTAEVADLGGLSGRIHSLTGKEYWIKCTRGVSKKCQIERIKVKNGRSRARFHISGHDLTMSREVLQERVAQVRIADSSSLRLEQRVGRYQH